MTKFEIDTTYEDGRLMVIARTDFYWTFIKDGVTNQKATFVKDGMEFYECEILLRNGRECVSIPGFDTVIEADGGAPCTQVYESDIREWLAIAQKNLVYIQHCGAHYPQLKHRAFHFPKILK